MITSGDGGAEKKGNGILATICYALLLFKKQR